MLIPINIVLYISLRNLLRISNMSASLIMISTIVLLALAVSRPHINVCSVHSGTVPSVGHLCFRKRSEPKGLLSKLRCKQSIKNHKYSMKVQLWHGSFIYRFYVKINDKCTSFSDRQFKGLNNYSNKLKWPIEFTEKNKHL